MEHTPQLSEYGDGEDLQQEEDTICQDKCMEPDTPDNYGHLDSDVSSGSESFACQHCERCFTSHQALEEHIHSHSLMVIVPETFTSKKGKIAPGLDFDQLQCDSIEPTVSLRSDVHHENINAPACSIVPPDDQVYEHHPCSCCEKIFTTNANKQQHESTVHKKRLQIPRVEQSDVPQEEHLKQIIIAASNHRSEIETEVVGNEVESTGNYMLDVSSSFSENLSFYLNGKIVSTSTVSGYEAAEVHAACSTLIGLDTLILDPTHLNMGLTIDSILSNQELLGQALAKRRIAVPPLLPQIQTELESEVVVSSSSSEIVASLIENILPKNTGSSLVATNSTDVFLSPKLDQIQETQDTLLTDGQTDCSSVSTATGRFKRRTGSPQSSHHITASDEETAMAETDGDAATLRYMDTQYSSILHQLAIEKGNGIRRIQETQAAPVSTESWPPVTADKSCSQQPLDLSNTITRNEVDSSYDAALDLSLQKRNLEESQLTSNLLLPSEDNSNVCMQETAVLSVEEQNISLANHETPLVSDLTIVTSPNMVDTVTEGVVYGLSLPSCPQKFSPATHTPLGFPPASPCTITFAPPTTNAVLPNTPSLITVLAPPLSIPSPSSQPIQVLAPNISPEPLLLCAENAIDSSQCDITPAFAATNAANIVTLAHPLDPLLNLPGHMFLTDHISLNPPVNEDHNMPEIPFTTTAALNEPLINSCNITSNTVLIECTISLDSPGNIPAAVTMHDNTEPPLSTQMLVNHIEQQQIVSLPNTATVDPTHLMSSIEESVTLSSSTSVMTDRPAKNDEPEQGLEEDNLSSSISVMKDCPTKAEESEQGLKKDTLSSSTSQMIDCPAKTEEPKQSLEDKSANGDEKKPADSTDSAGEITSDNSNPVEKAEETKPQNIAPTDTEQQTFAKNFICNVCNVLFHSMKELGHHVSDHAEEWPYKCEFCVLLFDKPTALLDHRSSLHGVDKTYMCSACPKDFVYLCNLKQHQEEFHPAQQCTFTEEEKGKIRHQNYNHSTKVDREPSLPDVSEKQVKKEDSEVDVAAEELFTTIKIMASDGGKLKVPDVRLGINQHYPSFKPPPFPYHNRSPAGSLASATNFTTHNIPQTFSTAIRCTKCGKSFDNMPELHKHILACASASDKRRYTPKKNPIPLRHFAKKQNGVLSLTNSENESNASNRASQSNGSTTESSSVKIQLKLLNKRKRKLGQRVMPQRNKSLSNKISPSHVQEELFVCPHCSREFTMQRSRTKHMAVCPKKPREVRTRKSEEISVTKENNGQIHSGLPHINEQRISAQPRTRLQTSTPVKRPNSPPLLKSISSKRPKLEDAKMDISTLNELHVVRSFNRPLRQYTRLHHGIKQIPSTQQNETHAPSREETTASGSC